LHFALASVLASPVRSGGSWVKRGEIEPDAELSQLGAISPGRGNTGGVRQAARETGVSPTQLRRDIAIASLTDDERASARPEGKPASQAALLLSGVTASESTRFI